MAKQGIKFIIKLEGSDKSVEIDLGQYWTPEAGELLREYSASTGAGKIREIMAESLAQRCDKEFFAAILDKLIK